MLTIDTEGLKLVPKGKRKGLELAWRDLVSGDAALAVALNASMEQRVGQPARRSQRAGSASSRHRRKPNAATR